MTDRSKADPDKSTEEISSQDFLAKGTILGGSYEILDICGQGGMAVVYQGIQKSLNRKVAIKVLHRRFVTEKSFVDRFDKEADVLASLNHTNVVSIIDKGCEQGRYYFVMEWLEGQTLDEQVIDRKITPKMWPTIIKGCSEGMTYVHQKGVIHRDLKPSNIMIGEDNTPKIGDFGIIYIIAGEKSGANQISKKKRSLGTEIYMAPEQETDDESVDVRADVYSLGVTFYKMFTRRMPKTGGLTPSQHNNNVPVAVDAVITKALSLNRDDRYQTVDELCNHLLKSLKKESTSITSVLGTTPSPRMAKSNLYTGSDFTPKPVADSNSRTSKLTPIPTAGSSSKAVPKPAPPKKESSNLGLIITGIIILLAILGIVVFGFLKFMGIA